MSHQPPVWMLYREGSLISFWGNKGSETVRMSFAIVSRVQNGMVSYFSSQNGRGEINRSAFESNLVSDSERRSYIRVEVF